MTRRLYCAAASACFWIAMFPAFSQAQDGPMTGRASFQAHGELVQYAPDVGVWSGRFVGTSVTTQGTGPLHSSAWDCTGETILGKEGVLRSGGYCRIADVDGDLINVLWERTNVPGPAPTPATRGTFLSGTGKFSGIRGHYTLACEQSGVACRITGGDYRLR